MSWKARPLAPIERENDQLRMTICGLQRELETKQGTVGRLEVLLRERLTRIDALTAQVDQLRHQNKKLDQEAEHLAQMVAAPLVNADEIIERGAHAVDYSTLISAARIILAHFSVNSTMNLPNSSGELANGTPPRSVSRAVNFGSARAELTSLLSLLMTGAGVFAGAPMPCQPVAI